MILYASQRAGALELAAHLLNGEENDHVTVHEIRGFLADDLAGALREIEAISRGTRCKQFLFSLSLNPPEYADVPIEDFEAAIEEIEKKLRLVDQPRIVIFHEKKGRRHCHVVWSRLMFSEHTKRMVAIRMSHFKHKLMEVSRYQFLKFGWKLPKGMERAQDRSPWHLTREEYRQSVRLSEDPQAFKAMLKGAWEQSDTKETFIRALEERGLLLAQGDRRGYVAVDVQGGVYSLTRWLDVGTSELKARLGKPEELPSMEKAQGFIAARMTENLERYVAEAKERAKEIRKPLIQEIRALALSQRRERQSLIDAQKERWTQETKTRMARIPRGVKGVWHKATGAYKKVRLRNEAETKACLDRDRKELHALVRSHLLERQELQKTVTAYREEHKAEALRIRREIARHVSTGSAPPLPAPKTETPPLAKQLARAEAQIVRLSDDLSRLQAALESNLIPDEMRARIRRMVEKTLETLHIKAVHEEERKERTQQRAKEYEEKQMQLNEAIRRYAEIQIRLEEEKRKTEAHREFTAIVMNMSYALNGLPKWKITVMPPPQKHALDEKAFVKALRQYSDKELFDAVFKKKSTDRRSEINPETAVPRLRQSVLEVKEVLRRAGLRPDGGGGRKPVSTPTRLPAAGTAIKFNAQRK